MQQVHNFVPAAPVGANYAEWAYFEGYHFQHIAAWQENLRLKRIRDEARRLIDRRRSPRGFRP